MTNRNEPSPCGLLRSLTRLFLLPVALSFLPWQGSLFASDRVALVIGIDDYENAAKLNNAVSDSRLVAEVLRETGFEVTALENPGVDQFYGGLEELKRNSTYAKVGIVYYAGHGIEVRGKNFLLPKDAELGSEVQLRSQAIALNTILNDLQEAHLPAKVLILDCCRDNPLNRSWMTTRTAGKGLAPILDVDLPEASVIVYSAAPGQVALDGSNGNSPFSRALATQLRKPGQNLFQSFLNTSDDVVDLTNGYQEPWVKMDGAARAIRNLVLVPPTEGERKVEKEKKESVASTETMVATGGSSEAAVGNEPEPGTTDPVGNTATAEAETVASAETEPGGGTTMSAATEVTTGETIGNQPDKAATPEAEKETEAVTFALPSRGFFNNDEVFRNGPYSAYNSYAKRQILNTVQGRLPGAGTPDGLMGGNTQEAIRRFQEDNAIPVTGLLDEKTLASLELTDLPEETYVAPAPKRTTSTGSASTSRSTSPAVSQAPESTVPPEPVKSKKGGFYRPPTGEITRKSRIEKKRMGLR